MHECLIYLLEHSILSLYQLFCFYFCSSFLSSSFSRFTCSFSFFTCSFSFFTCSFSLASLGIRCDIFSRQLVHSSFQSFLLISEKRHPEQSALSHASQVSTPSSPAQYWQSILLHESQIKTVGAHLLQYATSQQAHLCSGPQSRVQNLSWQLAHVSMLIGTHPLQKLSAHFSQEDIAEHDWQ